MPRELWAKTVTSLIWKNSATATIEKEIVSVPGTLAGHSLMEKRPYDGAALRAGFVHQGVEIRQQGISGLQDALGDCHEGRIPGHRVLPLRRKKECSVLKGHRGLKEVTELLVQTKVTHA